MKWGHSPHHGNLLKWSSFDAQRAERAWTDSLDVFPLWKAVEHDMFLPRVGWLQPYGEQFFLRHPPWTQFMRDAPNPALVPQPWTLFHLWGNPAMTSKMLCLVAWYPVLVLHPTGHVWPTVHWREGACFPPAPFVLDQRDVYNLCLSFLKTPSFPLLSHIERALLKFAWHCGMCLSVEGVWNQ